MSITFSRYVDITSGVAGQNLVGVRELIGRLFTDNPLLPNGTMIEFDTADDVGNFFGFTSVEYLRAQFYFAFVSKRITQPQKISFYGWADVARAPRAYGLQNPTLAALNAISAGTLNINMGTFTHAFTGLDFSAAASFAAVATVLQTAIQAYSAGGTLYTAATVVYDAVQQRFIITGGVAGAAAFTITDGAQSPGAALGFVGGVFPNLIIAPGVDAVDIAAGLAASAAADNNFGSFAFCMTLSLPQVESAAAWNASQNVMYQYSIPVSAANASAWSAALEDVAGCELTLAPLSTEYPEMAPMMLLAATDYTRRNAVQNFMYYQFNLTPSVSDDANANLYDGLRINYYGNTQNAGQQINFYQRGIMMGGNTAPTDMNTYANEQWLKSAAGSAIMNLLLALSEVPANSTGRSQILNQLVAGPIADALFNGTISAGKPLTQTQKATITSITGDDRAWYQVQNSGYWVDVTIVPYTNPTTNLPEYKAEYTLIYSKNDAIRKVEGQHVLI